MGKCNRRHIFWYGGLLIINAKANKNNGSEHTLETRLNETLLQLFFSVQGLAHAVVFFNNQSKVY